MLAAILLAAAAAAATPAPTASPTPTPPPEAARPKSLADIARERKLVPLKGAAAASAEPAAEPQGPLRVEELQDNGAVSDGFLSVYGKVRNTGPKPACRVRLFLRTYDEHGVLLSKGEATTDFKVVPPGEAVAFGVQLKVPPGVRGSQEKAPDVLSSGPARTNWTRVARVDGEVLESSETCR
jgi:hypothetical protein